ncbi:hypothetical protein V8D89_011770 [Ganoderma adspersum]
MLLSSLWALLFLPCFSSPVVAQGPVQTLFPAAIPLAVKTPYMNVWYNSWNKSGPLLQSWPLVWNLNSTTSVIGWAGKIRVNGTTYNWMGFNDTSISTNSTNVQITPTRSIFVMQAGPMNVTITFLSPIEPDDWVKQSIPFSYVSLEAQSLDGNDYPVQVYSDISAEWVSGDRSSNVQWSTESTAKSSYHKIQLQNPQNDTEIVDQAQDGTVYYAISTIDAPEPIFLSRPNITWQTGINAATRQQFQANGVLTNADQPGFTSISQHFPVFALAVDLGTIKSTNDTPITWSVGYVRDPSIKYTTVTTATEQRRSYYVTQYADIDDAIDAFTGDYAGAFGRAVALDQKIMSAAAKISPQYSDIVSLATRQTMAALDITVGTDLGTVTLLPGDVKIFMKNLGSGRRVNPVEHIYAAFPMFLYLNASIAGALLQPLLELQASRTDQSPAAQDIGDIYPVVSQPDIVPQQGVEQSGNMLIMELAHARMSGNGTLLSQYYSTTKQWADYLVNNALQSENQYVMLYLEVNQRIGLMEVFRTNYDGIIGVRAMAEIAHAVGKDTDATQYGNKASALFNSWLSRATSSDGSHLLGTYDDQKSWSLMYNLFADKMLGLNFVPQSVIDMQTKYLSSLLENASQWGLPIDSSTGQIANAAWSLFASAFVSDTTVRDNLIRSVYNHANSNQSVGVLPERYSVTSNAMDNGRASPGLGGLFSHLVLTVSNKTISVAPTGGSGAGSNSGAIAGGVIGGLAVVGVVVAVFVILRKRCRNRSWCEGAETDVAEPAPHHPTLTPYRMDSTTGSTHRTHGAGSLLDSAPVHVREGIRTGDMGVHHGLTSTANMADAPDTGETTAISLPSPGLSSKRRELPSNRLQREAQPGTIGTSPNTGSQTSSESSRDPSSVGGSHSGSSTDVAGLRNEMENLRRVVLEIREERLEPPPEYAE